jgi:RNA polymerase sigma-70 factor (ECF subfamily)
VKNKAINAISKKAQAFIKSPFNELDIELMPSSTDPYNLVVTAEMMGKMRQAIENLPPRCKLIFKLIREDGLKYKEVAEILNISVNTIDVQMAIAVRKLCMAMQKAGMKISS